MKKSAVIFFVSTLLIAGFGFTRAFADASAGQDALAQDFSQKAMNEFKSINDLQLNYAAVSSKVDEYSQNFARILLATGVGTPRSGIIMQKAAAWYGQALEDLFNGKPYNPIIQDYSGKISDLLNQQHIGLDAQSSIVTMTSDNLEALDTLFQELEEVND
jgi:hypothetical protein